MKLSQIHSIHQHIDMYEHKSEHIPELIHKDKIQTGISIFSQSY